MTRSIRGSRRAALLLSGMAAATALLVTGCGAGQVAETANKEPSIQGVNIQTPDNDYKVRGLYVEYPGIEGYRAGGNAPVNAVVYNDTREPVTVTVTTDSAREVVLTGAAGSPSPTAPVSPGSSPSDSASPSGSASPSDNASPSGSASARPSESASPSPSAPAGERARFEIPALGYLQLTVQGGRHLELVGLNEKLLAGQQVNLTFDFGNGKTISTPAPIGIPLTPAAPPSPIVERHGGYEGQEEGGSGHG
ncbi:copper chaperone PCu(A)C [Micromonospora sp. KC723]|uniref:copper chaperone PCu(A)C n=1 Tax=Micromonospora sp. KC723 TaxID=2530381 RepID=UPI001045CC77|nr:copper chaperone PCu(A)C [Micromonospora sp. KC723]TDB70321.1 copper chaperone PCu(A)C [Micromonospora sp. KC723]